MIWGRDFNGSTGANHTSYKIDIPSNDTQLLRSCLLIVRDWADGGVNMSTDIIDSERGPVLQERAKNENPWRNARREYEPKAVGFPDNRM